MHVIRSAHNPKLKYAQKLLNKRQRTQDGLFRVDDSRDLLRALEQGYQVDHAFYCADLASVQDKALQAKLDQDRLYQVDHDLMHKLAYRQNPGGIVAILHQKNRCSLDDRRVRDADLILGLVDLRKPGNIGALLRTADAVGVGAVCLIDCALDLYNPNIIRASTGAVFLNNIVETTYEAITDWLSDGERQVIAAHLAGDRTPYDIDFFSHHSLILLGSEATGLGQQWLPHCDSLMKIPMVGQIADSLNVSVSGAIILYEAFRQRSLGNY